MSKIDILSKFNNRINIYLKHRHYKEFLNKENLD